MNQRDFIILGIPDGVEPSGVRCLSISEGKVYEQMDRPRGRRWVCVENGVDITGQRLVDFLFRDNGSINTEGTIFNNGGGGLSANKIMAYSEL